MNSIFEEKCTGEFKTEQVHPLKREIDRVKNDATLSQQCLFLSKTHHRLAFKALKDKVNHSLLMFVSA